MKVTVRVSKARNDRPEQYWAWCPALPGCRARGSSPDEAVVNIDSVIRGYLASLNRPTSDELEKVVKTPVRRMTWVGSAPTASERI